MAERLAPRPGGGHRCSPPSSRAARAMNLADLLSATGLPGGDMRPLWVAVIALAAGVSRGFTGFGAGMIFIPSVSALYSPPLAIARYLLEDWAS